MNDQNNHQGQTGEQTCRASEDPAGLPLTPAALLESLLFVASGPTPVSRLAAALELTPAAVTAHLRQLEQDYQARGLRLLWVDDSVQLTTAPMAAPAIERFLGLDVTTRLSPAALEVLAIVAYRQPATRPQIEQIRGVNSDASLRTLLSKGLIEEVGRVETAGRPILYGTTPEFLRHFGLTSLADLPPLNVEQSARLPQQM